MTEKIYEALHRATEALEQHRREPHAAWLLLQWVTQKTRTALLADQQDYLTHEQTKVFNEGIIQLQQGMPIQYITGEEYFYGYRLEVNEHVLIPRPETEELVYGAIERCKQLFTTKQLRVADVGTGSGAIAIAFKKEWPEAQVTATDISTDALTVARNNALANEADIRFIQGDLLIPIQHEKWDVILSNPPYIAKDEAVTMENTVLEFEPHQALFAEEQGLQFYRRLSQDLSTIVASPFLIGVEIGHLQGEAVYQLFHEAFPNAAVEIVQDINGKDRIVFCKSCE